MCMCFDCGGVDGMDGLGEWVGGLASDCVWEGGVVLWLYVCHESEFFVYMAGPDICIFCKPDACAS